MFLFPLLLSGVIALGAGAAERKLTPEQCTNLNELIKLEETKLASLSSENEELYNCALTSDMGDMTEDIRDGFLQIITAENNLNKQKRKFIASLKETSDKNCSEHEEVRASAEIEELRAIDGTDNARNAVEALPRRIDAIAKARTTAISNVKCKAADEPLTKDETQSPQMHETVNETQSPLMRYRTVQHRQIDEPTNEKLVSSFL